MCQFWISRYVKSNISCYKDHSLVIYLYGFFLHYWVQGFYQIILLTINGI